MLKQRIVLFFQKIEIKFKKAQRNLSAVRLKISHSKKVKKAHGIKAQKAHHEKLKNHRKTARTAPNEKSSLKDRNEKAQSSAR